MRLEHRITDLAADCQASLGTAEQNTGHVFQIQELIVFGQSLPDDGQRYTVIGSFDPGPVSDFYIRLPAKADLEFDEMDPAVGL